MTSEVRLALVLLLGAGASPSASIQSEDMRVVASEHNSRYYLTFSSRAANGGWRTILGTGVLASRDRWTPGKTITIEDPRIEWNSGGEVRTADAFFSRATEGEDGLTLVLSGQAAGHEIEETITIAAPHRIHVTVRDRTNTQIDLGQLMSHFSLIPDGRAEDYSLPLEFAWLPVLHGEASHYCSDHFFRSPAAIAMSHGAYAALVPDLDLLAKYRPIPHALDLRVVGVAGEVPRLSYGISTSEMVEHMFSRHAAGQTKTVNGSEIAYGFDILLGEASGPEEVSGAVTSYLWERYGRRGLRDIRPQVLPFEEYGRRYAYVNELKRWATAVEIDGKRCVGIDNEGRRGANFHAWENDLHVGFGIAHYAKKWDDQDLLRTARGILQLSLTAPEKSGAFPCIYNFRERKWEGSLFWTARAADAYEGYDAAAMGTSSWWRLYWYENLGRDPEILKRAMAYARFLKEVQRPSGAIPTYFYSDLSPASQLLESATTAISGAVLAKTALLANDPDLKAAALSAGRFIEGSILPRLAFQDFETFYSCSEKPLHWIDNWSGILPQNTLAIQWSADQFLALYRLTGDRDWLRRGEYILSLLSLYQQVWTPPYAPYNKVNLYGGFGVMNTDGEWNDGRQARFVSTYADYYAATGRLEYLERAIAAARAGFALMDIKENHANNVNRLQPPMTEAPGLGYAPENIFHGGPDPTTEAGGRASTGAREAPSPQALTSNGSSARYGSMARRGRP